MARVTVVAHTHLRRPALFFFPLGKKGQRVSMVAAAASSQMPLRDKKKECMPHIHTHTREACYINKAH